MVRSTKNFTRGGVIYYGATNDFVCKHVITCILQHRSFAWWDKFSKLFKSIPMVLGLHSYLAYLWLRVGKSCNGYLDFWFHFQSLTYSDMPSICVLYKFVDLPKQFLSPLICRASLLSARSLVWILDTYAFKSFSGTYLLRFAFCLTGILCIEILTGM